MNILVVLRPVRDPAGLTVNRKAQKLFVNRESFILNPPDRNALEAALTLAGAEGGVIAVALGGEPALEVLRLARASGAGRAICLTVPQAPALDALGITNVLRQLVANLGSIDLVLLGADVLDSDAAQVGPRLAAALDWQFVDRIFQATAQPGSGLGLVVSAEGTYRLLGVDLPAVAAVARDSNKPRFAPAAQIINVYADPESVETLALADIGLDLVELVPATVARGESFPPERALGTFVQGEDAIRQLAEAIRSR